MKNQSIKKIVFDAGFEKAFEKYTKKLSPIERKEVRARLRVFQTDAFDVRLKTHKLHGELRVYWSFSISRQHRIIFRFINATTVLFVDVGGHEIY